MTLKTSSRKINPALNMFGFTIRKNIGLIVLVTIATLLICPGFILSNLENIKTADREILSVDYPCILTVIGCGTVVVFNLINFLFLYSKRSSDVFLSVPLTRTELLVSRCLAGFVFSLIPIVLSYISLGVIVNLVSTSTAVISIAICFAYTVMCMLVCSSFSMIFVVCAGSAFDLVVSFAGINIGLIVVSVILSTIFEECIYGYSTDVLSIMRIVSPFVFVGSGFCDYFDTFETFDLLFFIKSGILVIIFTLLSVILFNKRKAERGGDAYAYRFIYIICSLIISFCGAFFLGGLFSEGFKGNSVTFWIFALIGAVLVAVAYSAVTHRTFKNFKGAVMIGVCATLVMAIIFIISQNGGLGYASRLPKKQEIKNASVHFFATDTIEYNDPSKVLSLHKSLINNKDKSDKDDTDKRYIDIIYRLKNGKKFEREYTVDYAKYDKELMTIYNSDEHWKPLKSKFKDSHSLTVSITINNNDSWINSYLTADEFNEFLDLYIEESKNTNIVELIMRTENGCNIDYYWGEGKDNFYNGSLIFGNSFKNTKAYLDSLNLNERTSEPERIDYVD